MKRGEQGAALLSVLLIVAVVAVLAAASLQKLRLATRLAANAVAIDQARAYAMAAETVALYRIGDLVQRDAARTTLDGDWAGKDVNFPIDGGIATARLSDGGNCFNLNTLVQEPGGGGTGYVVDPDAVARFERLMLAIGVSAGDARTVSIAAADWIDSDSEPLPGGAEDAAYAVASTPYRTANTLMADPSELRAVAGVSATLYSAVRPLLCALPVSEVSPINVNTLLPDQAPLLAMLVPGLDPASAKAVIAARPAGGYQDLATFWKQPALKNAPDSALRNAAVKTRWFGLRLMIELGDAEFEENALIDGALRPAKLARRSLGAPS
jgi:general secretion pathway protein K